MFFSLEPTSRYLISIALELLMEMTQIRTSFSQAANLSNPKLHIHRLIFAGKNGITPINYRKKWTSLTSMLCRPELRIHDVRHWVAASLLRSGVGVGVASQIMGHRDQTMLLEGMGTLTLAHFRALKKLDGKFQILC
jgi:integrase